MTRPRSIAIFDIAYLGALAINVAGPFLIWSALTAAIAEQAHAGADAGGTVQAVLIVFILLLAALGVLLWWLVARLGSNVVRWVVVVLLGLNLAYSATQLAQTGGVLTMIGLVSLLGMVFTAVALASLLMPDARGWFADQPEVVS